MASTTTMYRQENGRTYHAFRKRSADSNACDGPCLPIYKATANTGSQMMLNRTTTKLSCRLPRSRPLPARAQLTLCRHHLCILTLRDRLFLAPVDKPNRVLDLGKHLSRSVYRIMLLFDYAYTGQVLEQASGQRERCTPCYPAHVMTPH